VTLWSKASDRNNLNPILAGVSVAGSRNDCQYSWIARRGGISTFAVLVALDRTIYGLSVDPEVSYHHGRFAFSMDFAL